MSDLITPVIVAIFGTATILVVMGFFLVRRRESRPRFETQDYYKTYKRNDEYSGVGSPFRQNPPSRDRNEQRIVAGVVIGISVAAIIVSTVFGAVEGLLLFISLPVIMRFVRTRREASSRRNAAQDENHPSY
ncbi:MAG: hypothetical protein ACREBS_08050 [Nitrososphaerales archaeon]